MKIQRNQQLTESSTIKIMENSYVTPHDIKSYDQLSGVAWDKLTEIEKKIAVDGAKRILDQQIVWKDQIKYFASEKMQAVAKRERVGEA